MKLKTLKKYFQLLVGSKNEYEPKPGILVLIYYEDTHFELAGFTINRGSEDFDDEPEVSAMDQTGEVVEWLDTVAGLESQYIRVFKQISRSK